jgi:hypothetical protein
MQNPIYSGTTLECVPEVQIIQGVATVVTVFDHRLEVDSNQTITPQYTTPENCFKGRRNEYDLLKDPNVMMRVDGTYDTYKCADCNIVLSGYKRGDPGSNEHVRHGKGQCRYVKLQYRGREKELIILQGRLRFQSGMLAFPDFMLYSNDGYVTIAGTKHCIICTSPPDQDHYMACPDIGNRFKATLKHLKVAGSIDSTPLFTRRGPGHEYRWGDLETDSCLAYDTNHFGVLGESANMYHLPNTVDTHKCFMCNIEIKNFVENDTLLGEHIFHVYNTSGRCKYLTDRYTNREDEMMLLLGKERYRRGKIAFPESIITNSAYGYTSIRDLNRCVVCSALTIQGRYLPSQGHHPRCDEMTKELRTRLKTFTFIP